SSVVSTLFMTRMRHRENIPERAAGESHPKMWPQVREGLAWVLGNRTLRSIAGCTGTSNFFGQILFAILVLYAVRVLHLSSVALGAVFAVGSVGSIGGALAADRLRKRFGVGPAIVTYAIVFSAAGVAFPL